jgi:hypothetical protein
VFWGSTAPIAGPGSVGQFVALAAAVTTIAVFVAARALLDSNTAAQRGLRDGLDLPDGRLHWWDVAALALALGIIGALFWLGLASLFERSFVGAVIFSVAAVLLSASAVAVTAYAVFIFAVHLTPLLLSVVLAVFLVAGTFTSMLSATDPLWWQKNLSTLGISDDLSARAFNLTLIVAGVIVTTTAHYATAGIPVENQKERRGRTIVYAALALIGVLLACVGLFPLDRNAAAHNASASGMAVVFVALVIGLRFLVPRMPRMFLLLGYAFVAVIAMLAGFFLTGYYNLTAVELVAFLLIFSWLIVFIRNTVAMSAGGTRKRAGQDVSDLADPLVPSA